MIGDNLQKKLPEDLQGAVGQYMEQATDDSIDEVAVEIAQQATGFIDRVNETLYRYESSDGTERDEARAELFARLRDIQNFKANAQQVLAVMPDLKKRCASVLAKADRKKRRPAA
ncbi:MAG: hypothetical protein RIT81_24675 [Deltaproteobacteria bacterium]